ncbi:tyrosine/lipid phosphatase LipA [Gordonia sinesedis]
MTTSTPAISRRTRTLRAAVTGAAALAVAVTPAVLPDAVADRTVAVAAAAPAVAAPQEVRLAGTQNTRTFAAYRTVDGAAISPRVLRSDNLSKITPADQRALAKLRVTTIIDLRTSLERTIQPNRAVPGARARVADVLGGTPVTNLVDLPTAYRAFVTDPGARRAFRSALLETRRTVESGQAILVHCTAGKDRTGWYSAVLLTILGVDRATVERDFLASNRFRHANANDPLNGVNIAWLRSAFATADRKYGSFDGYVRKGLGLTQADIDGLRSAVLGNA